MNMKTFAKGILGSLLLAGAVVAATAPAEARVGVSVNLGVFAPGPVVAGPAPVLPGYCYGPYYYSNCAYAAYGEPVFWNGYWYNAPPYRFVRGRREFWLRGGWHDEGRVQFRGGYRR
jgi:hypothetical protein